MLPSRVLYLAAGGGAGDAMHYEEGAAVQIHRHQQQPSDGINSFMILLYAILRCVCRLFCEISLVRSKCSLLHPCCDACHATTSLPSHLSSHLAYPSLAPLSLRQSIDIMTESNRFQMALVFCKAMIIFEKRCTLNTLALSLTKK